MKNFLIYMLLIIIGSLLLLSQRPQKASSVAIEQRTVIIDPNYVQNPYEAQERLKAQGYYHGKIDGLWGPKSDKAYCNWCGVQAIRKAEQ